MIRTVLLSTAAVALTATAALASPTNSISSNGAAMTSGSRVQGTASHHVYSPPTATVIFDSIGTGYYCCEGYTVSAASSVIGTQYWPANQITPTSNGKVTSLKVGVGYVEGDNGAELAIYKDAAGIPGKLLWSGDVSSLPNFGSTSTVTATAKVTKVKIKANKPFWVAIQTDANSAQTWDAWNLSNTTTAPVAENSGSGWVNDGSGTAGGMTVYGKLR
ncbi:MAG TPA: hypothetical protein VF835_05310 [Rhizomicrobium sp.]